MNKKYIILILVLCTLIAIIMFGILLGSFGFTRSKKMGKTNYYLVENVANTVGLYYKYPDFPDSFVGVLEGQINDVYWDEEYILVTQYSMNIDSIRGYYIIKMLPFVDKGVPWKKIGALSKKEYEQTKQELLINEKKMKHTRFK